MDRVHAEYRITKKGSECYRTAIREDAYRKFKELNGKRPGVYAIQSRYVRLDRYGVRMADLSGKELWTEWH